MRPLRVTATLETGQVATIDGHLPLDSILAYAWIARHRPELLWVNRAGTLGATGAEPLFQPPLPLERREECGEWFWASSSAQYRRLAEDTTYWHKRFDALAAARYVDFRRGRGRISTSSGPYKAHRTPLVYIVTPELTWYAMGEREAVASLLSGIVAIGKKRGSGYGQVVDWVVEDWPEDLSCRDGRGRPMRSVPCQDGPYLAGVRPPSWHPANHVPCDRPPAGGWGSE